MKRGPLKIFYSYAHEDETLRDRIDEYLELLRRQNLVLVWHDRHIVPGSAWNEVISEKLTSADIVLLLVSRAFMESRYVREVEIPEAMKVHRDGSVRVIPVLLDKVKDWKNAPFAKLEILPTKAKPISEWKDPIEALRDIARGVRKVVKDIIVKGGGPFEFGAHEFSKAELAMLPKAERERTALGIGRLRADLNQKIPARSYESNLLVATWALRQFGRPDHLPDNGLEGLFYMAQVISSFDLIALQEIDRDLSRLDALMEVLGPDWSVLVTDVAPGVKGNRERFAILYYRPRINFQNFSSQVVLPPERSAAGSPKPVLQFARPPLLAAFRSGGTEFQVCTAHIVFGGGSRAAMEERLEEIKKLGTYLRARSKYENKDLLLMGDFQMGRRESPILDTLRDNKVQIPDELLHPTNLSKTNYYDLIGFTSPERTMPLGSSHPRSGAYDLFQQVLRDEDYPVYQKTGAFRRYCERLRRSGGKDSRTISGNEKQYRMWKTLLVSDHLPLWAELKVDKSPEE